MRTAFWPCATGIPLQRGDRATAGRAVRRCGAASVVPAVFIDDNRIEFERMAPALSAKVPVHCVETFYRNTMYLDAVVEKVDEALSRFESPERPEIVFSAHSIPMSVVEKGDPYQRQIEETVRLLTERGGWRNPQRLCYQSKVGASRWLQPSLHQTLRQLAKEQVREMCVVPVAFVSDHVETLGEIDHEAREEAHTLGFAQFEMSAGLNDSPKFIHALGQIVLEALGQEVASLIPMSNEERKLAVPEFAAAAGLD